MDDSCLLLSGSVITPELFQEVSRGYPLDLMGTHGVSHWKRVEEAALRLAELEGIESDVFSLFALFHDSRRFNDYRDDYHGRRGAQLARELHGEWFDLPMVDLERLCYACEHHTTETNHSDPVIGICWDADRLDLPRVGIEVDVKYLSSRSAVNAALELNIRQKTGPVNQ